MIKEGLTHTQKLVVEALSEYGIDESVALLSNIIVKQPNLLSVPYIGLTGTIDYTVYVDTLDNRMISGDTSTPILYMMNECNEDDDTLIITQHPLDALAIKSATPCNVVATPLDGDPTEWIDNCRQFMNLYKRIIVMGRPALTPNNMINVLVDKLETQILYVPQDCYMGYSNPTDLLKSKGKTSIIDAIALAQYNEHPCIIPIERVSCDDTQDITFSTRLNVFDQLSGGIHMGDYVVVTGDTGVGKSTLTSHIALEAIQEGHKVFYYSGEISNKKLKSSMMRIAGGVEYVQEIKNDKGQSEYQIYANIVDAINEWMSGQLFIYNNEIISEYKLIDIIRYSIKQYGCDVIIIDNMMTAVEDDMTGDMYRQQSVFVKEIIKLAKTYNVAIILVAHLRKAQGKNSSNADVYGSSAIGNLADLVVRFSLPDKEGECDRLLTIMKNRRSGEGRNYNIKLYYEKKSSRIAENKEDFTRSYGWEDIYKSEIYQFKHYDSDLPFVI